MLISELQKRHTGAIRLFEKTGATTIIYNKVEYFIFI
jgi:hypothetical protein